MSYEALPSLQSKQPGGLECLACERRCVLKEGATGFCSGYTVENGVLRDLTFGKITTAQVTQLGWAPVSRFANPHDKVLSVGTRGCNLRCSHCVNHEHAFARHDKSDRHVPPNTIVDYATAMGCQGVAPNFNEGLLAVRYWRDVFETAKANGLYTVAVTNGYATPEALDVLCPNLDVYRCDIKAFRASVMRAQGNINIDPQQVLRNLMYVHNKHPHVHIETVTMVSPGVNDSPSEIQAIASWVKDNLGPETPWHVSPMDPVDMKGRIYRSPTYLQPTDMMTDERIRGLSMTFGDDAIRLSVGETDLLELDRVDHNWPALTSVANIGRDCGLKDVIVKTDGH